MGNLSFLVPLENKEEIFNKKALAKKLSEAHRGLQFIVDDEWEQITVERKGKRLFDIFFGQNNYLLSEKVSKEEALTHTTEENWELLTWFQDTVGDSKPCLQVNYGNSYKFKHRRDVMATICELGNCFYFDEGIHPEFTPPPRGIAEHK